MSLVACGSSPTSSASSTGATPTKAATSSAPSTGATPSEATATSAGPTARQSELDRWNKAYSYLGVQTKPTEIACGWFTASGATPSPVPRPARFYSFSDTAAWKKHLVTRNGPFPKGTFEDCVATVPTAVPYGDAIESFLGRFGLTFVADPNGAAGLTPVEIAYAGQDASDPDIIYRDKPGLFGLRIALAQLGKTPFESGTSKIVQPTNDATAARYLRYATPLLSWYGYPG